MVDTLSGGGAIAVTPDGPRGPRYSMNPGIAWMARATGARVVPVGIACDRFWALKSWDHFTVPRLRARVFIDYGPLLALDRSATDEEQAAFLQRIRDEMLAAETRAFQALGREPDRDDAEL